MFYMSKVVFSYCLFQHNQLFIYHKNIFSLKVTHKTAFFPRHATFVQVKKDFGKNNFITRKISITF